MAVLFVQAQTITQNGVSYRYNGKNPRTPIGGVYIKPVTADNGVVSNASNGSFSVVLKNLKMGSRIGNVKVTKQGMMVFNQQAVDEWNVRKDPLCLILCDANEFQKQKKNLIAIGEKQAKKIIGYSFEEIKSIPFSANVYTLMMKNMEKNLIAIGKSKGEFKSLEININSPEYLCDVLKELSPYLYQMDKNYRLEFNGFLYAESFNSKYEPFNFAVSQNSKDIRTLVYTDKNERGIFR